MNSNIKYTAEDLAYLKAAQVRQKEKAMQSMLFKERQKNREHKQAGQQVIRKHQNKI